MRMKLIAGNWKMNMTGTEAKGLASALKDSVGRSYQTGCVVVCPTFTALKETHEVIKDSAIKLGAQNLFWEEKGAFTGEISADMIKDAGCSFVVIGHSERRKYFSETNQTVNKRIKAALNKQLTPIVCVGESLEEREADKAFEVVEGHVRGALEGISSENVQKLVIAYEPVWAIGTGKTATPQQAEEIHKFIRGLLKDIYTDQIAQNMLILYGGSVKPDNIEELINEPDLDGALVGGASLKADAFSQIVQKSLKADV